MTLLGSNKRNITKNKSGENVPHHFSYLLKYNI